MRDITTFGQNSLNLKSEPCVNFEIADLKKY